MPDAPDAPDAAKVLRELMERGKRAPFADIVVPRPALDALLAEVEGLRAWAKQSVSSAIEPCVIHREFEQGCVRCVSTKAATADALAEALRNDGHTADLKAKCGTEGGWPARGCRGCAALARVEGAKPAYSEAVGMPGRICSSTERNGTSCAPRPALAPTDSEQPGWLQEILARECVKPGCLTDMDVKLIESDAEWHERCAAGEQVGWSEGRHLRVAQELRILAEIMRAALAAEREGGGEDG